MSKSNLLLFIVSILVVMAWSGQSSARQSRLSMAVAEVSSGPNVAPFLQNPGAGYVQAYVRFASDMPDDVIMTLDQEFIDGVISPFHISGGDWMGLVGVQRSGLLWVAAGTSATMHGIPSTARNWQIKSLGTRLQPNVWYLLRTQADFRSLHFKSFTISGPGINKTVDLSSYALDYPNYMPFNSRMMTYYVGAMRSANMATQIGTPVAYFDDVSGGTFWPNGSDHPLFANGFEWQSAVSAQPLTPLPIQVGGYLQGLWYLERAESLFTIQHVPFAHSGSAVGVAKASLMD
jgi:hypothetical protein